MAGAVFVYGAAAVAWRPARAAGGFTLGRVRGSDAVVAMATGALSSAVLVVWLRVAKPDLSDLVARIPRLGWPGLIAAGVLFALVNSVVEEALFRGVLWSGLSQTTLSTAHVVIAQAACFGAAHFRGFPRGGFGVLLAFVYGLLLGVVRHRTGGILWPVMGHLLPDLTIFLLVAWMAGQAG